MTLDSLTLINGFNFSTGDGGGIYNDGALTLNRCTVSGCKKADFGAGIFNIGMLTLNQSTLSGNNTTFDAGGGIYNAGTLTLNQSTISGNDAFVGGGIHNLGTLTLSNSIVAGNTISGSLGPDIHTGQTIPTPTTIGRNLSPTSATPT